MMNIVQVRSNGLFASTFACLSSEWAIGCLALTLFACSPVSAAFITEDFGAKPNGLITDTDSNMQWLRWDFIPVTMGFNPVTQETSEVRPSPNTVIGFTEDPNSILFGFRLASQQEFEQLMTNAGLHTIILAPQSASLSGQFMETFGDSSSFESEGPTGKTKTKWMFGVLDTFDFTRFEAVQKEIGGNEQWVSGRLLSYLSVDPNLTLSGNVGYALVRSAGLSGDYNGNGVVDAADYSVWLDSLGATGSGLAADGTGDSIVDQADYDLWKANFGATSASASNAAVPEPAGIALLCVGLFCILFRRELEIQMRRLNQNEGEILSAINTVIHAMWLSCAERNRGSRMVIQQASLFCLSFIILCSTAIALFANPVQVNETTFLSGISGLSSVIEGFETFSIGNQPAAPLVISNGTYQSPLPRVIIGAGGAQVLIDNADILAPRIFSDFVAGTQFWGADFLVSDSAEFDIIVTGNSGLLTLSEERGNQFDSFVGFSDPLGLLSVSIATVDFSNSGGGGKGIGNYAFDNVVTASPLGGDYNGNGNVDAADYTVWLNSLGQTGSALAADGTGDSIVDQADYDLWKANFGATSANATNGNNSVPEPTSMTIVFIVLWVMGLCRWVGRPSS